MKAAAQRTHLKYDRLIAVAQSLPPVPTAVAHPCNPIVLEAAVEAAKLRLIHPILVGPPGPIEEAARRGGVHLAGLASIGTGDSHDSAGRAVALVREGRVEALMKGSLHINELMDVVTAGEGGIRTARRMSHCFIMDVPGQADALIITDAALNIAPSLEDKVDIV